MKTSTFSYEAPELVAVEVAVESGFQNSPSGFDGPYFDEEDVDW